MESLIVLLVLLGLLVIVTPPLTLYLLLRQNKLRTQLAKLTELSLQQADALHREMSELKRQVSALQRVADSHAEHQAGAQPQTHAPVSPRIERVVPPIAPVVEKKVEPVVTSAPPIPEKVPTFAAEKLPEEKKEVRPPIVSAPISVAPPSSSVAKPEFSTPVQQKPVPETTAPPRAVTPPAPIPPTQHTTLVQQPVLPKPTTQPPTPSQFPHIPPPPVLPRPAAPITARVSAPQYVAPLHTPAPRPTAQQRMKSVFALEETLGTNWLNKLGIIILVLGVALFGIYELGQLGPAGKVALSYAASAVLLGAGIFFENRERYRVLGHTLIGGGWAVLFFTTYGLNHIDAMRVLSSEVADLVLMLAVAIAMVVHTLRYRSQLVTGLAFLLAYTTVTLSHDNVYSLAAGVILALGLVSITIKLNWFELEVFGILSSFLNHLYWLYKLLGVEGAHGQAFPEYQASTALLFFYWFVFRISYVVRKIKTPFEEHVSTVAALLNTLLLLGIMKFQSVHPELAFYALLVIGAAEFCFAQLPITKRRREAFIILSVLGTALMVASVPFHYTGNNVVILWLVGAEAFLVAGVVMKEVVFRRLGLLTGLLAGAHLVVVDFMQLVTFRNLSEEMLLSVGILFALCAVTYYLNALFIGEYWQELFTDTLNSNLLSLHSYLGGFAAMASAWALCSRDWTALAFAGVMLALAAICLKSKSIHLQVQYGLIGALTLYRVLAVNMHMESPPPAHVSMRLWTIPFLAAAFYLAAKWAALRDDPNQRTVRGLFAVAGTILTTLLIYYEVPELWRPLAAIVFAVVLLEVGRWVCYYVLTWHSHLLSALSVLAAVTADPFSAYRWHTIPVHAFAALPVVAGAYWVAKRINVPDLQHTNAGHVAYSWIGTGLMVWVLSEALRAPWIAVGWIAFAVVLALAMRWIGFRHLGWQANAVAACAVARVFVFKFTLDQTLWQGISQRLATVSLVAAGLYFISRRTTVDEAAHSPVWRYLHTSAATALLATLAWYEAPGGWLAAVWAAFALVLVIVDYHFKLDELNWQVHALAALTVLRSVTVNLYVMETWHGVSLRLLTLAIVAVVLYALSRLVRMPEDWRAREFHHIYSWAASVLVSLLMWYELQPLSVAVGWAVFGLVLFEYGLWRAVKQFRFQAYVAFAAAFSRIFFSNLTAESASEFLGPRMYTVLPLALILFFVYAQLKPEEKNLQDDCHLHFDALIAYLGTGSIVALLYFQFASDWVVTAWSVVILSLFGIALLLDRPVFLHQALLLTLGTCGRSLAHNLFGASYFSGGDWTGRYVVLGSAIAVMLACLPFAFRLRSRYKVPSNRWAEALVRRPEQVMFFVPVLLLTLMLALKMRAGMVTVAWGLEGVLIVLFALAVAERSYRLTGLCILLLCVGKVLVMDAWGLAPRDRYITFIILGMALLLVSFLYTKYRETIRQFL